MLPEYYFDYQQAKPNRFATRSGKKMTIGHHNLLIQEILSDPSGIAPDTPEEPEIAPSEPSEIESASPENTNDKELDQFFSL